MVRSETGRPAAGDAEEATERGSEPPGGLVRNAALNVAGSVAPLVLGLVAIPLLIEHLGMERFGLLSIVWVLIGYLTVFDLGLGRALTQIVADRLGTGREERIGPAFWTGLWVAVGLGALGTVALYLAAPWLVASVLNVPAGLVDEGSASLRLLALGLPLVVPTTLVRGLLEAHQRFGLVNAVRVPMGAFTFAGPLLVLPFSVSLTPIVGVLLAARVGALAAYLTMAMRVSPSLRGRRTDTRELAELLSYGGWITVSNLVSPVMVYFDRFFIGALASMAAVTYYVTPYEVVTKLLVVPVAVAAVMFPAFAASYREQPARTVELFRHLNDAMVLMIAPLVLVLFVFAPEGLSVWVGEDFAVQGSAVARWLLLGVFLNALAQGPFALLQAQGRPDLTAKLHMVEAPLYLVVLWLAIERFGVAGAAFAWTLRIALDTAVLYYLTGRLLEGGNKVVAEAALRTAAVTGVLAVGALPSSTAAKLLFVFIAFVSFGVWTFRFLRRHGGVEGLLKQVGWEPA